MTPQDYIDSLIKRGLPPHIAKAFVWNFSDESGLRPGINEAAPVVHGSRGGYGLYQLTGPRRVAYEAFAADKGLSADNPEAQMDFLMRELGTTERAAWNKISAARDTPEAAAAIVNSFLRPSEEHRAARESKYLAGNVSLPRGPTAPQQSAPPNPMDRPQMAFSDRIRGIFDGTYKPDTKKISDGIAEAFAPTEMKVPQLQPGQAYQAPDSIARAYQLLQRGRMF